MTWKLDILFDSDENAKKAMQNAKETALTFNKTYKNKLSKLDDKEFLTSLKSYESIYQTTSKVLTYTFLKFSQDSKRGSFYASMQEAFGDVAEQMLFYDIEFNALKKEKANQFIKYAKDYSYYLEELQKFKPHQLTAKEERIVLKKDLTGSNAFGRLFDEHFSNMSFTFDGKKLTEEEVLSKLYDKDRNTRKKAATSLSKELKKHQNLLTFIYNMIKTDLKVTCELRGYKEPESSRHIDNQITKKSVDALIDVTCDNFDISADYYHLKAKLLGYEKLYDYDRYAPVSQNEAKYDYEKSKKIVLEAFEYFDKEMADIAKKAFDEGWIDVYPKDGKRSGAYSHPATPDTHPFVMLNHTDGRRDLFTLAHELGHAIHQYLSREVGYLNTNTPLTTSETASVFAEMLVFDYLLKSDLSKEEKISLYTSKLEDMFATLFRQIIFTTFERRVHSFEGELKAEELNKIWLEENQKMFKDSVILTPSYKIWWSYIPHFVHSPFYCYAYSYGQLLTLALYGLYKNQHPNFKEIYKKFLSAGGSQSPKDLVSLFGLDIDKKAFWKIGIQEVKLMTKELETLIKDK